MPVILDESAQRAAYWPFPLVRAVPAAILALVITFSADHSARFGLIAFGGFAIFSGVLTAGFAARLLVGSGVRPYFVSHGVVSAILGGVSLSLSDGGVPSLLLVLTVWAALTAALELYSGLRTRQRHVASVDWVSVGAITAVAAIVFVLIPPEFAQQFTGPDGVPRVLDAAVVAVGLLGAYAAIIAVYLVVAALSAKWGTQKAPSGSNLGKPIAGEARVGRTEAGPAESGETNAAKGTST